MPVPRSGAHIRGLVNVRGQVILIFDIARILGFTPSTPGESAHIIILKTSRELAAVRSDTASIDMTHYGDKPVGFLADSIGDVVGISAAQIEKTPTHMEESELRFYEGVVNLGKKTLIILNAGELTIEGQER
jgi:purine-binding chemotaxis protein CheW